MSGKEQERGAHKHFFILSFLFLFWSSKKEKAPPTKGKKEEIVNLNIFSTLQNQCKQAYQHITPILKASYSSKSGTTLGIHRSFLMARNLKLTICLVL